MVTTATTPTLPSSLTAPPAQPGTASTDKDAAAAISSDFETFLKMMTAQLQNQDPLNPVEQTDYAVQLATFSGVEQQVRTNDLLEGLGAQLGLVGLSDIAGWVGMEAKVTAPAYFEGQPITVVPDVPSTADKVELQVKDKSGAVVQTYELSEWDDPIIWGGGDSSGNPLPFGNYTFETVSSSNGKLLSSDQAQVYSRVQETQNVDGTLMLIMSSGAQIEATEVDALRAS